VYKPHIIPKCYKPSRPSLYKIDTNKTLLENSKVVIDNLNKVIIYSEQLETTVDCYETYFKNYLKESVNEQE
jgi:hypothetical protein